MLRIVCALLLLGACYREQAAPPQEPVGPLQVTTNRKLVCEPDDIDNPVTETFPGGRLRSQGDGPLTGWQVPEAPEFIPAYVDSLDLFLVEPADGGYFAFYREPYDKGSCKLGGSVNCAYEARHYDKRGQLRWKLRFDELLSRKTHLEIQDIRLAGGVVYFNEACQGYSAAAKGKCSSLVAVEPKSQRVLWRTPALTSNGRIALRDCYVIAGYGFTNEPDALHVVDRASGTIVQTIDVASAPQGYTLDATELVVELYSGASRSYRTRGFDGPEGKLEPLDGDAGGLGYGGIGYGGP